MAQADIRPWPDERFVWPAVVMVLWTEKDLFHTISTIYNAFDIGKNTLEKIIIDRILLAAFMCVQWDVSPKFCICPTASK